MLRASKFAVAMGAVCLLSSCSWHLVSYDPKEAAGVALEMRESFRNYRKIVPVPEGLSIAETEDIIMLGDAFDENATKLHDLLSK